MTYEIGSSFFILKVKDLRVELDLDIGVNKRMKGVMGITEELLVEVEEFRKSCLKSRQI